MYTDAAVERGWYIDIKSILHKRDKNGCVYNIS